MTAYSMAFKSDVRKRMSPPNRQDVPQISKECLYFLHHLHLLLATRDNHHQFPAGRSVYG